MDTLQSPSQGFEFPTSMQDTLDKTLRESISGQPKLKSARPGKQEITPTLASDPKPTVANNQASINPISEAESISIALPSKFAYYDFKDLYIKPFRLPHLGKLAKAAQTTSTQTVVEAVSSVLSTPEGTSNIGFKLCMADFNTVLYWLRLHTFGKKQARMEWTCQNPEHHDMVRAGTKPVETLRIQETYRESDITTVMLDDMPDPNYYRLETVGGFVQMRPETMMDTIEFLDHKDWQDPEFQFKARLASVLDLPMSLGDKVQWLDKNATTDDMIIIQEFSELSDAFGIQEMVNVKCKECGASQQVKLVVDASCFLSPKF